MIAVHLALLPLYVVYDAGTGRWVLVGLGLTGAGALAVLGEVVGSGRVPTRRLPAALAYVVGDAGVLSVVHLALTGDAVAGSSLLLVVVGAGALLRNGRAAAVIIAGCAAGWVAVAASGRLGRPLGMAPYSAAVTMACVLALVVHRVRAGTEGHLATARDSLAVEVEHVRRTNRVVVESERRFRRIFSDSPVGIALTDGTGLFVDVNDALCVLLGRERAELLGRSPREFTHPDDIGDRDAGGLLDAGVDRADNRFVRPDGSIRWAALTVSGTPGPRGERWSLAHVLDITETRAAEQALRESEAGLLAVGEVMRAVQQGGDPWPVLLRQLGILAGATTVSLVERDGNDALVTASFGDDRLIGARRSMTTATPSAAVSVWRSGQALFVADAAASPFARSILSTLPRARSMLWQPLLDAGAVTGVLAVTWTHRVEGLSDRAGRAVLLLAQEGARAMAEWNRRNELTAEALTDPLTGMPNRRSPNAHLGLAMAESSRSELPMTVAMVDLDHFKAFNDRYGHLAGDRLLVEFAAAATTAIRGTDLAARWGGEEFAILLPGCPPEAARPVLERLRLAVPGGQHCSIGFSTWNGTDTVDELTAKVDRALYVAKDSGRNTLALL